MVLELVPDMCGQGVELVVWQLWPQPLGYTVSAEIIERGTIQAKMFGNGLQRSKVKLRVVGDDDVGGGQVFEEGWGDGRKLRRPSNIEPGQTVAVVGEFLHEPPVAFWRPYQPVEGFGELAAIEYRQSCGADARARVVGGLEVYADGRHSFELR